MKNFCVACLSILTLSLASACHKPAEIISPGKIIASPQFVQYTIRAGQQYCDQNVYVPTNYSQLRFVVRFDSSAIYQTVDPANQLDVNKLYGFSDNNSSHHEFSARFGWRWSDGALRLFGYVYNNGQMSYQEIGKITIGTEYACSIKVNPSGYLFTVGGTTLSVARASTTTTAVGYKLYPYFGGDESAPHDVRIWIKELQ